jgi:hypothetical protein
MALSLANPRHIQRDPAIVLFASNKHGTFSVPYTRQRVNKFSGLPLALHG